VHDANFILLFDARREHISIALARSAGAGGRSSSAEGLSLMGARQAASDWGLGRAMIRGEPTIGRDQSREPRL
jgi:hypothetical protein